MKQKLITAILLLGCITVGVFGVITFKNQDRTAPIITVSDKKMSYIEGDSYDELLEGVTATDKRDGDLTNQVFVDKIIPTSKKKAVVYYGVVDKANNVGTARKTVKYRGDNNLGSDVGNNATGSLTEESTQTNEQQDTSTDILTANGENPVMTLGSSSVIITKGSEFNPLSMVKDVADDKDEQDTLYRQLHVDGTYDTSKSGTYELTYYVQDSDGNTSEPIIFTLTVQ